MKYDAPKEFKILSTILISTGGNITYTQAGGSCFVGQEMVNLKFSSS
jgi:hypothetical protein